MLNFLVPKGYSQFNLYKGIGKGNAGGGIAVKYARCVEAAEPYWESQRIESIDAMDGDILCAEFNSFMVEDWAECVKSFLTAPARIKILCMSDLSVLKAPKKMVSYLIEGAHGRPGADFVTHNCKYQQRLLQCVGISNSLPLCDPVPETLFYPAVKKLRITAIGQIAWYKRSDAVLALFEGLKDSDIETCYIGGADFWGNVPVLDKDKETHERIKEVADEFIENASTLEVASKVNTSTYYGHFSIHDVANQAGQENLLAGNTIFSLTHPINKERPGIQLASVIEMVDVIRAYDKKTMQQSSEKARKFGLENYSYGVYQEQLSTILRMARQL